MTTTTPEGPAPWEAEGLCMDGSLLSWARGRLDGLEQVAHDAAHPTPVEIVAAGRRLAQHRADARQPRGRQVGAEALVRHLAAHLLDALRADALTEAQQPLQHLLGLDGALEVRVAARAQGLAQLLAEGVAARADLVAAVLAVVDQRRLDHVHLAEGGGDDGQPLVVHP